MPTVGEVSELSSRHALSVKLTAFFQFAQNIRDFSENCCVLGVVPCYQVDLPVTWVRRPKRFELLKYVTVLDFFGQIIFSPVRVTEVSYMIWLQMLSPLRSCDELLDESSNLVE